MSNSQQLSNNFFDFPSGFNAMALNQSHGGYVLPPIHSPPYLWPVSAFPSLAPSPTFVNSMSRLAIVDPTPKPPPSSPEPILTTEDQINQDNSFKSKSKPKVVNGVPVDLWKAMNDKEREDFLKHKRRQDAYKTALCSSFEQTAECKYGNECRFAHGKEELRPKFNHPKYKTVLCRNYAVTGVCPYGWRCQFIHILLTGNVVDQKELFTRSCKPHIHH